ncbi:MAG TPA: OmpA family protein [Chitinophaga sp.]|nr:OmpA family protein [Chitinophaga sp.]
MKKSYSLRTVFVIAVLAPFFVKAQSASNGGSIFNEGTGYRRWSVGVNGGLLAPVVPIGGSNDFSKWKASAGYGAYVKWQILHALGLRADYTGGKLAGDNSRNLGNDQPAVRKYSSFETKLKWSASLSAVVNVATINWLYKKNAVQIYVSAGGGLAGYSPSVERTGGELKEYKPSGNIKEFIVPVGAGLKFKLTDFMNLDLGYTMHFVDGDNLDGYVRGSGKDKYSYGYGGLEFSLGRRDRPQLAWQNPARVMYDDLAAQKATLTQELAVSREANAVLKADMDKLKADDDGDGVSNIFDKCPGTRAGTKVDGSGCELPQPPPPPAVTQVTITEDDRRLVKDAIQNLEFQTGKSSIKPSSYPSLNRLVEMLKNKGFSLKLGGHTDNVGNAQKNMALSKDRAESVKQYLVSQGANPSKIEAVGYGADQPIASNKTAAGRQKNRRVEFTLY